MKSGRVIAFLVLCNALVGCDRSMPASRAISIGSEIESGNALFADGDYAGALAHYRAAAEADTANAAAWFGVHMAGGALGDSALAAAALARVHRLVPDAGPVAHPAPLPAGHPPIQPVRPPADEQ
jgi:tetratricopeptide (TPR) repeat protein